MLSAAGGWTDLGGGIHVRQSRAYWMNSVVLLSEEHSVVVDPGVLPSELDELAAAVRESRPGHVTLVFTHAHWDHVLGRPWWPDAATIAHVRFSTEVLRDEEAIRGEAARLASEAAESWNAPFQHFEPDLALSGNQTAQLGPWLLSFRDAPGHCDSQVSVHLPERRLLLAADMLSDIEIPMLNRPAATYRRTLEALRQPVLSGEVERLVPGHGAPARGAKAVRERLERDLAYLDELEFRLRAVRAAGGTLEQALARLAGMEYTGKTADYSMAAAHSDNVRVVWKGLETEPPTG